MSTRYERRKAKKSVDQRAWNHPSMRRIRRNMLASGSRAATEVYRLEGKTPEDHTYFDIFSMRAWALENAQEVITPLPWDRAERLIATGAVDPNRIQDHTIRTQYHPIIIGIGAAGPGNDQILDGAHRVVALCLGAAANGMEGAPLPVPAYVLQPDEWRRFLIPRFVAKALGFDREFDDISDGAE
ncbi:hypothetical protein ACBY01_07205 [Sphingomonas sp. ac-8]|uniref:hypothetical protein n=1 Tax=Sphingomonas sp. ac-8 TaxID=3242977 RepID=UPI003A80B898